MTYHRDDLTKRQSEPDVESVIVVPYRPDQLVVGRLLQQVVEQLLLVLTWRGQRERSNISCGMCGCFRPTPDADASFFLYSLKKNLTH